MRYTLTPKLHLSQLPLPTRLLLTGFVLSILAALWVGSLKYTQRAEFTPSGAQRYWHGEAESGNESGGRIDDGIVDVGPDALAERKSTRHLVDIVHPHLFTVPILLFILLHLLILTRLRDGVKIALQLHAFASFAATFSLPFLVAGSGQGAGAFIVAGANLLLSFVVIGSILLVALWWPRRQTTRSAHLTQPGGVRKTSA